MVLEISNTFEKGTRLPRRKTLSFLRGVPFGKLTQRILGKRYALSLVVCGDTLATRLNAQYRRKTYSPNVLSFPLSRNEGEIILNVRKAEREAQAFGTTAKQRLLFLFIHGCLHLAGYKHGNKMDRLEQLHLKKSFK
jgi:rRNA maturation RNase YbeY